MKLNDFQHAQWYQIKFSEQDPDHLYFFMPYIVAFDSWDDETIRRRYRRRKMVQGTLITVDEYKDFYYEHSEQYAPRIIDAKAITVRELMVRLLGIIVDDHNQWVEPTGLTSTGQPPMLLRTKPNGWICLDAGSFLGDNLKRFGVVASAIEGNYELLESEVLSTSGGRRGVCFEIELHGDQ